MPACPTAIPLVSEEQPGDGLGSLGKQADSSSLEQAGGR